jgi:hypothetical protein
MPPTTIVTIPAMNSQPCGRSSESMMDARSMLVLSFLGVLRDVVGVQGRNMSKYAALNAPGVVQVAQQTRGSTKPEHCRGYHIFGRSILFLVCPPLRIVQNSLMHWQAVHFTPSNVKRFMIIEFEVFVHHFIFYYQNDIK